MTFGHPLAFCVITDSCFFVRVLATQLFNRKGMHHYLCQDQRLGLFAAYRHQLWLLKPCSCGHPPDASAAGA